MQDLLAPPRTNLTEEQVEAALSFRGSAQVRSGVTILNYETLDPLPEQPDLWLQGGEVDWAERTGSGPTSKQDRAATVFRTATLDFAGPMPEGFSTLNVAFQPYMEIRAAGTGGEWVRFNLGVFTATMPTISDDGMHQSWSLDLADYAQRWATPIEEPIVAPFNRNIILFVREDILIDKFEETKFDFPSTDKVVEEDMVFMPDGDTTYLDVMNAVLESRAFEPITTTADGFAWSRPVSERPTSPEWVYEPGTTVLMDSEVDPVLPDVPNVLKFVAARGPSLPEEGNGIRTKVNLNDGPASVNARNGREVLERIEVEAEDQVELDEVAEIKAQFYFAGGGDRIRINALPNPLHDHHDVVGVVKPRFGFDDNTIAWRVTEWAIPLGPIEGDSQVRMSLTVERLVDTSA